MDNAFPGSRYVFRHRGGVDRWRRLAIAIATTIALTLGGMEATSRELRRLPLSLSLCIPLVNKLVFMIYVKLSPARQLHLMSALGRYFHSVSPVPGFRLTK